MIWSTTRGDLVAALAVAQGKFADPEKGALAGKEGVKQWRYANLADFLPDVRAVLAAEGIAILQSTDEDGKHLVTELVKGEQWVRVLNPLGEAGTTQAFGSEITYARRYALMAILGLAAVDDDDDGKAATDAPPPARKRAEPAPKLEVGPNDHDAEWANDSRFYHKALKETPGSPTHDEANAIFSQSSKLHSGKRPSQIGDDARRLFIGWLRSVPGQHALAAHRDRADAGTDRAEEDELPDPDEGDR